MYLDEAMKETIDICFTSADMKAYLKSNLIKLSEYQMAKIISGAPIPLEQKLKEFEKLASFHNKYNIKQEEFDDESYSNHMKALKRALAAVRIHDPSEGLLLLLGYKRINGTAYCKECVPFYSYAKLKHYLNDSMKYSDFDWYEIEKYMINDKKELEEEYVYILVNGEMFYFQDYRTNAGVECCADSNLNLPVPFKRGDIITVQMKPFHEEKKLLIVDIGDNNDCCCVQALFKNSKDKFDCAALKHGSHIFKYPTNGSVSPLYSAEIYEGELHESEQELDSLRHVLKDQERYIKQSLYEHWHAIDV